MELEREGLEELEISFTDNKPVLDLFLSKPVGLLSLLNDQCRGLNVSHMISVGVTWSQWGSHNTHVLPAHTQGSKKAFVQKCKESFAKHPNYVPHRGNALVFTIKHYAGNVSVCVRCEGVRLWVPPPQVEYKADGFLDKNKDSLPDSVVETLRSSGLRLTRTLFLRQSEQPAASQIKKSALPKRWGRSH